MRMKWKVWDNNVSSEKKNSGSLNQYNPGGAVRHGKGTNAENGVAGGLESSWPKLHQKRRQWMLVNSPEIIQYSINPIICWFFRDYAEMLMKMMGCPGYLRFPYALPSSAELPDPNGCHVVILSLWLAQWILPEEGKVDTASLSVVVK